MTERVDQQLGNYRLVRLIGQGAFADVYLGEHIYLRTPAAIKVLQTRLAKEELQGFLNEARAIANLVHPNIVRVLEFGVEGDTPFLVMDYAPNGTLRQLHPKGSLVPPAMIAQYTKQAAAALQYAHDQHVIHRDIKPENMLLGRNNEVLISDFGIAVMAQSSRYQHGQEVGGTIAYMAPEQLQGRAVPASDQYSLGVVVYEWLCGERPFQGSFPEIASQHMLAVPAPLHTKLVGLSMGIEEVVMTALSKEPQHRFLRIQAFATALEHACQGAHPLSRVPGASLPDWGNDKRPSSSSSPMFPPQPTPSGSYSQVSLNQSESDMSTLPGKLSSTPVSGLLPTAPPSLYPPQGQGQSGPQGPFTPGQMGYQGQYVSPDAPTSQSMGMGQFGPPPMLPTDHDQQQGPKRKRGITRRKVVFGLAGLVGVLIISSGGTVAWYELSRQHSPLSAGTPPKKTPQPGNTATSAPSPTSDPTASATGTESPSTTVTETATQPTTGIGSLVTTYTGHTQYVDAVAWSPDGSMIASASGDNTVQVWNASTGENLLIYRGHSNPVSAVVWSADGTQVISASDNVQVWDASSGNLIFTYSGHSNNVYALARSPDGKRIASGGGDGTVQVWNAAQGNHYTTYNNNNNGNTVYAVTWSPDGNSVACTSGNQVNVWNVSTGATYFTYNGHSNAQTVESVDWSPNGKRIASGADDKTVQVWDASTGSNPYTYLGHSGTVNSVEWSSDGSRILSGGDDSQVQIWNAANGSNPYVYLGHHSPVLTARWSPNGKEVASGSGNVNVNDGSDDHSVQVWNAS
jgi:WD40 repeat protein/tRNA A-37 threonylcarbamoyl transferase component Bud32